MTEHELNIFLEELCRQPQEQQWLEFKLNKGSISNEEIGQYISAISNGATIANKPFGYLVWGVENETHAIKGTNLKFSLSKQGNQDIELWLRNLLNPCINFEVFEFNYHNKHIVLIRIPCAKGEPTIFQNIPYIRINSNKTDLRKHTDLIRIIYNSQDDWSSKIIPDASLADLDFEALMVAMEKFKEKNTAAPFAGQIDNWDDKTFLDKAKITINGQITNTAILLLGKEEASHYVLPAAAQITWKPESEQKDLPLDKVVLLDRVQKMQIGRASCRERV